MEQSEIEIRKRTPLRRRFLTTVLLTTVISILAASITGYFCIRWIRSATEETLTEQLEINLRNIIEEMIGSVDAKLEHYEKYIEFVTDSIENMYSHKEEMIAAGRMIEPPADNHEYALTRGFVSDNITKDDVIGEIRFFSNLERIWEPLAKENEDLISTIYLGTRSGLLVSYDRYSYLSVPQEGEEVVYNYYFTDWFRRGMQEDGVFYTGIYMDSQGRGLTVTVGSGIKDGEGNKTGVICMDFDLSALYKDMFSINLDTDAFTFVLDHDGILIAPDSDTLDLEEYTGLTLDELDRLKSTPHGIMEKNNSVYVCVPIEHVDWTLCARVPKEAIQKSIHETDSLIRGAVMVFMVIVVLILIIAVVAVNQSVASITYPLELLGKDIKIISDGNLDYRATVYRNDEIGDITSGMNEMVDRLNFTMHELLSSQEHADAMSRLATLDSLTGIRNKTAFDRQMKLLEEELSGGMKDFGFVMLDLNNLKVINDNYGHEKGDIYIKKLSSIICDVFDHSPVFRVGGDEFIVILKNADYQNIESLVRRFKDKIRIASGDRTASPWDRVSAAIGYALYDETLDRGTESVLARADKEMYICKKAMKEL